MIAETEDAWVGMATGVAEEQAPRHAWLVGVWVDPGWRGRGVGDQLVREVIEWARSRNAVQLRLEVGERNRPAIGLYQRCGFVATGEKVPMERDPSIVEDLMVLLLAG